MFQEHVWVTRDGKFPLPSESENCILVTVTEEEVNNVVKHVPKIETLVSSPFCAFSAKETTDLKCLHREFTNTYLLSFFHFKSFKSKKFVLRSSNCCF